MKKSLIKVLSIPSTSKNNILLAHYILKYTSKIDCERLVDSAGNILLTKGESKIYPCVTAHLDTVQPYGNIRITEKNGELTSPDGIGGDDKCGIFICLELLKYLPILKVVFFAGEESGCQGSNVVNMDWFEDCGYIIGIDRRGNSDYINEHCQSKSTNTEFDGRIAAILDRFKYRETTGMITDVFQLQSRFVNVSVCNLSCGYYEPHTLSESVVIRDVFKALFLVKRMIKQLGYNRYDYTKPKKKQTNYIKTEFGTPSASNKQMTFWSGTKPAINKCVDCANWPTCKDFRHSSSACCTGFVSFVKLAKPTVKISKVCSGCHLIKRGAWCASCQSPHKKVSATKSIEYRCALCSNWFKEEDLVKDCWGYLCKTCKKYQDSKKYV